MSHEISSPTLLEPMPLAAPGASESSRSNKERMRINLSWLHKLRWAAVVGQLATIFVVVQVLKIDLPWGWLVVLVGVTAATNAALGIWLVASDQVARLRAEQCEWLLGLLMLLDIALLTAVLALSGGPANPFTIFYLVNISLAAAVIRPRWAYALGAVAIGCFAFLFVFHHPVSELGHDHHALMEPVAHHEHHAQLQIAESPADSMNLHLRGMLIAFGGACAFIVYSVTRVTSELARREAELDEARQRRAYAERLESLATLAAGAAHELATPLSTVAVLARELECGLTDPPVDSQAAADAREIRSQVARCQHILQRMASASGEAAGEALVCLSIREIVGDAVAGLPEMPRIEVLDSAALDELRVQVPRVAITQSLRAILKNALDASPAGRAVAIDVRGQREFVDIHIIDDGYGMTTETMRRAAEPFFTTKQPGSGMGLGLFLAHRVCQRLGGDLRLKSKPGSGTTVTVRLPLVPTLLAAS